MCLAYRNGEAGLQFLLINDYRKSCRISKNNFHVRGWILSKINLKELKQLWSVNLKKKKIK